MSNQAETTERRPAEKTLIKLQAISGLVFALFLLLHLANSAAAMLGQGRYDQFQRAVRHYYQFPAIEIAGVLGAAAVHVYAAVVRMWRRRAARIATGNDPKPPWRTRLHRYSGYYLMAAIAGHVAATRGPGLFGHAADFSFLNFSMTVLPWFFYPYYAGLFASGFYHLVHGTVAALRMLKVKLPKLAVDPRSKPFWALSLVGAALGLGAVLALGGNFFAVNQKRFAEWKELAAPIFEKTGLKPPETAER